MRPWNYLLPSKSVVFDTSSDTEQLAAELSARVERQSIVPRLWYGGDKVFQGTVTGRGFRIQRLHRYGNNGAAILLGQLTPTDSGTRVELHVGPDMIFLVGSMLSALAFGSNVFIAPISGVGDITSAKPYLLIVAVLVGIYLFNLGVFWLESRRAIGLLRELVGLYLIAEDGRRFAP